MSYIVIPALIAFLVKLVVLVLSSQNKSTSKVFLVLMVLFAVHNLCEMLIVWDYLHQLDGSMVLRSYYALTVAGLCAIFMYACEVSHYSLPIMSKLKGALSLLLCGLIFLTDYVVSGSTLISYSITVQKGTLYLVWQLYCIATLIATVTVILLGFRHAKEHRVEIQCIYTFMALMPLIVVCFIVLGLMAWGFRVNGVISIPIATTLFIVIMVISEYQHRLTDVRRFIPWSSEYKTSRKIMDIFSNYSRDKIDYREAIGEIERLLVLQKYDKNSGNASETANKMGMPRSSLYSIFNRLKIESRGDKN